LSDHNPSDVSRRIPVGIILMVAGFAIILCLGAILLIVPRTLAEFEISSEPVSEDEIEPVTFPDLYQTDGQPEAAVTRPSRILPTPAELPEAFILPHIQDTESEGDWPILPSVASYDEAPKDLELTDPEQPVRLNIPALDIDASIERVGLRPVVREGNDYLQWQVPNGYVVGWHESSATLGHAGNTVLNGHNNIHGSVFKNLVDLELGDLVIVHDGDSVHEYTVVETKLLPENGQPPTVRGANARWIGTSGDERITLVSCWPFTSNDNRIIVVARPAQG